MSQSTTITLTPAHGVVLLECVAIGIHLWATGMSVLPLRQRLFNRDFYDKNFSSWVAEAEAKDSQGKPTESAVIYKSVVREGGYPDSGSGRLAARLDDLSWLEFNFQQRAHANYLEGAVPVLTALLGASIKFPRLSAQLGLVYIVGRVAYNYGYTRRGARGRFVGAMVLDAALLGLWGLSTYGLFKIGGGARGLLSILPGCGHVNK